MSDVAQTTHALSLCLYLSSDIQAASETSLLKRIHAKIYNLTGRHLNQREKAWSPLHWHLLSTEKDLQCRMKVFFLGLGLYFPASISFPVIFSPSVSLPSYHVCRKAFGIPILSDRDHKALVLLVARQKDNILCEYKLQTLLSFSLQQSGRRENRKKKQNLS